MTRLSEEITGEPGPLIDLSDPVKREVFDALIDRLMAAGALRPIPAVRLLYDAASETCVGKLEQQDDGSWRGIYWDAPDHWVTITQAAEDGAPVVVEEESP